MEPKVIDEEGEVKLIDMGDGAYEISGGGHYMFLWLEDLEALARLLERHKWKP